MARPSTSSSRLEVGVVEGDERVDSMLLAQTQLPKVCEPEGAGVSCVRSFAVQTEIVLNAANADKALGKHCDDPLFRRSFRAGTF
ncbi:MAG: hypothetical protein EAZ30_17285 [Betaproteobacteria bacterium]|nr:MAG: hypothetical protein EAZ30_17285 [Betaproteobacteria bacterium]